MNGHRDPSTGLSPRVFEIGGAGGLIISDNVHAPDFFEQGVEMLHWSAPEEVAEYVVRAQRDTAWAANIASNGRRRAESEHRIGARFESLLAGWGLL